MWPTRRNGFRRTVSHNAILHHPLDQPVAFPTARGTVIDALGAQIVVPGLADAAVIVFIGNRATAVIAIDAKHSTRGVVGNDREVKSIILEVKLTKRCVVGPQFQ